MFDVRVYTSQNYVHVNGIGVKNNRRNHGENLLTGVTTGLGRNAIILPKLTQGDIPNHRYF